MPYVTLASESLRSLILYVIFFNILERITKETKCKIENCACCLKRIINKKKIHVSCVLILSNTVASFISMAGLVVDVNEHG